VRSRARRRSCPAQAPACRRAPDSTARASSATRPGRRSSTAPSAPRMFLPQTCILQTMFATLKKLQHAKHCALRVNISYPQKKECLEGEYLKFKAHIRGWKTMAQKERCKNVLSKVDHHLRQALLGTQWKDVLLVPQEWYPEYTPRYETKGWWYVPAEAVLGRACKSCNAFCELADFAGTKRQRTVSVICYKCNFEEDWTDTPVGVSKSRTPHAKGPHAKGPH
jgi:hypothetical protein